MDQAIIKRLEKLTAIVVSITILVLLILRAEHAGALWRDESGLVQLSQMPRVADIVANFPHEAFPPLFPILVRGWSSVFGTSDMAFRGFGALVGALFIGVAWINGRLLTTGVPLLSLGLIGLNSTFLTCGTAIRGYGLAAALIALAFGLMAKFLVRPTPVMAAATAAAYIASAYCLVHNSVLLLAISLSAITVCLARRDLKRALIVVGIGLLALVSFLPCLQSYLNAREWDMTVRLSVPWSWLWAQFKSGFGDPTPVMAWVWLTCLTLLIGGAIWRLYRIRGHNRGSEYDLLVYGIVASVAGLIGIYGFLHFLRYYPQPWYFLSLLAIIGFALDLFANALSHISSVRITRLVFTALALVSLPFGGWQKITERQTNIDILADTLQRRAAPSDLIVVSPWQFGIPFNWYYHGQTPWITLPQLPEHRMHRYDLVKARMISTDPIGDVREAISDTLHRGDRVWIVGEVRVPQNNAPPTILSTAPDPKCGWDSLAYVESWTEQLGVFMRSHVKSVQLVAVNTPAPISDLEDSALMVARGWKDAPRR